VAAYVNGASVDRNDPKLSEAYVARMVDLGLPELAFHQAETLTTLESNNGLAWGVIAYVEARRGNMAEAISAINLAGQFAPDKPLVERTAGEIAAWYDLKADKATLSESARNGLATIRGLLEKRPEFANAYETAKKAYKAQASAPEQPVQSQGPSTGLQTVSPTESVSYYPDYTMPRERVGLSQRLGGGGNQSGSSGDSTFSHLRRWLFLITATSSSNITIIFSTMGMVVSFLVMGVGEGASSECLQREIHRWPDRGEGTFKALQC
jgi:hypothetical protein